MSGIVRIFKGPHNRSSKLKNDLDEDYFSEGEEGKYEKSKEKIVEVKKELIKKQKKITEQERKKLQGREDLRLIISNEPRQ